VMFVLQNTPVQALDLGDSTISPVDMERETAKFDLTMSLGEIDGGIVGSIEYNTDLFVDTSITLMIEHFQILLEGIAENSEQRLTDLPILTGEEKQKILVEWNDTKRKYPRERCVHELFEEQVERTPDAIAVEIEDQRLTYCELNTRANQLAHFLRKHGVEPDVSVGICMERSLEMVVGIIGVLKAGGAYLPMDPEYPKERLTFILEDARSSVLLTQERLIGRLPEHETQVFFLDKDWVAISRESNENPVSEVTADNLAYVIYTSGSTGKPKGVMICHSSICNRLLWEKSAYHLSEADRILQKTSFSFDVSVRELFEPLLVGARLILARSDRQHDCAYIVRLISERKITAVTLAPSMLEVFLDEPGVEKCNSLRRVNAGGEVLNIDLQERFFASSAADLYIGYGPTEATIAVTYWICKRVGNQSAVPIGRPIANTQIYILDRYLRPVPIGVTGEIHIGGDSVARGYLNRPELTAEKFIPNPFSNDPGERLYRTGDLARYLPDGNIVFLGRIDHQVKIRGFRIETGEIECVLREHPSVQDVAVIARKDETRDPSTPLRADKCLVAYVVIKQEHETCDIELRSFLKQKLPEYMVPSYFVTLDELPLTLSGKIDRKALPEPDRTRPGLGREFVAPRNPTEEILADIWSQVLGIEKVGVYDNFFELGGHSLLATQVVYRARDAFKVELPLRNLVEEPTVARLAEIIDEEKKRVEGLEAPPIKPIPRDIELPISLARERLGLQVLHKNRSMEIMKTYVVGQANLGYSEFEPGSGLSDVILATFPKSGSTWTSYLMHQLRSRGDEGFHDIKDEVVDITPGHWDPTVNPFLIEQRYFPRTFKTHGSYTLCPKGGKYIYIARNPKDTLFSLYHFIHDLLGIEEIVPIEDFYKHYYVERFGTDHDIGNVWDHFLGWYPHRTEVNVLWLHYEDLLEDRSKCIRAIAQFMGVELDENLLQVILERSSLRHMRQISSQLNPSRTNRVGKVVSEFGPEMMNYAKKMKFGKMRRGVVGYGQKELPQEILNELEKEWRQRITSVLSYGNYEEMRRNCSLLRQI
jgi:amino acid adenylation domain-containing protein